MVEPVSNFGSGTQKTIKLQNGFEILVGGEEDFDSFKTYTLFKLNRNGIQLFQDTSQTEYEFGDKLYPLSFSFDNEKFNLLVEVNDRPSKNYLKLFKIDGEKLVKIEKLPTFIAHAKNLDSDNELEFAGFWDYPQISSDEDGNKITAYNPILYYYLSKRGLEVDTALTKERNTAIYGKFYGFEFMESIEVSSTTLTNHDAEVERIKNLK
ncbi:hypothetical protein GCM10023183_32910 [Nibribacter koreensis]|uniref:Uncharacterized protein n=2 Tax=Nibribacter koreensis TaxID=1084519 RepID=A0ABP8FY04_9BACT